MRVDGNYATGDAGSFFLFFFSHSSKTGQRKSEAAVEARVTATR